MSLGEHFPKEIREEFSERNVKIGSVISVNVTDTDPPKVKRLIIVASSYDKIYFASVFINTNPPKSYLPADVKSLHLSLDGNGRDYLDHDSFADCSYLHEENIAELRTLVASNPDCVLGEVSAGDMLKIRGAIKSAKTITPADKKKFGVFL